MAGPAPMPDDLVAIARAVLAEATPRATLPADAAAWEALYRSHTPSTLPWHVDTLEPELAAALLPLAREDVAALDLGTGTGIVARYLARLGCGVTATDVSTTALTAARAMDGGDAVTWRVDDVTQSTLTGPYGLVVDRACLHALPRAMHVRWAETLRRVASGATLVALVHDTRERNAATQGYDEAGLRALLDTCCEAVHVMPATMRGAQVRRAWLATGRVRGA